MVHRCLYCLQPFLDLQKLFKVKETKKNEKKSIQRLFYMITTITDDRNDMGLMKPGVAVTRMKHLSS
jgi:hypothetical protein